LYNHYDSEHLLDMGEAVYARMGPAALHSLLLRCDSKEAVLANILGTAKSFVTISIATKRNFDMELAEY
jgi:hypothetical protein